MRRIPRLIPWFEDDLLAEILAKYTVGRHALLYRFFRDNGTLSATRTTGKVIGEDGEWYRSTGDG